ncbi:MAG: electron transporter RnfC [Zetaproteobacteria bacterium CG2_30_46_52]|nr:MAG: electron transporter RnfC [Zetaproteobacteria bacterium CG2_30_46_52]
MFNLLHTIKHALHLTPQSHAFRGGVHLSEFKRTATKASEQCPMPRVLMYPVKQHIGQACEPLVKVGDRVLRGQKIGKSQGYVSVPIHASTSGIVTKIENHIIPHPSGMGLPTIFVEPDGLDEVDESLIPLPNYRSLSPVELRERVRIAGIAGLGGAVFPTFIKLLKDKLHSIETVILNGIECEPWLTNDHQLMLEKSHQIITGLDIVMHMVGAQSAIVAIEDNTMDAAFVMQNAVEDMKLSQVIKVEVLPTIYPQGGEKQLIQALTGKEVPAGRLPIHIGVLSTNVGTAKAIHDAVCLGEAMTERLVTVSGDALPSPKNMFVRFGTPVCFVLEQCGLDSCDDVNIIHGGPMMGEILRPTDIPVVKASNGLLAMKKATVMASHHEEEPCIRCGDCSDACPAGLMPNLLAMHCKEEQFERAENYQLFDCIECGACSYVCPSHIPLVHYFRFGKGQVAKIRREKVFAEESRQRSESRDLRLRKEQEEKEEKRRIAQEKKEARAAALAAQAAAATDVADEALTETVSEKPAPTPKAES